MKRIPAILFCILFCVSFAGCSTSSGSVDSSLSLVSEFEEDRQAAFAAGMDDYLAKPIEIDKLLRKIVKVLEKK